MNHNLFYMFQDRIANLPCPLWDIFMASLLFFISLLCSLPFLWCFCSYCSLGQARHLFTEVCITTKCDTCASRNTRTYEITSNLPQNTNLEKRDHFIKQLMISRGVIDTEIAKFLSASEPIKPDIIINPARTQLVDQINQVLKSQLVITTDVQIVD